MRARYHIIGLVVLIAGAAAAWAVHAAQQPGTGGGRGSPTGYDPRTVTTITGKVTAETRYGIARGAAQAGVHLTLKSEKESLDVHLGPSWYVDEQTPKVKVGDTVSVTGSRLTLQGQPALIAAQVNKEGATLKLRDVTTGVPNWSRGRGRRGGPGR